MKHFKKLLSIFLLLGMLVGISQPGDGCSTLSDTNPAPPHTEIDIDE